jgi:hypothetical protein
MTTMISTKNGGHFKNKERNQYDNSSQGNHTTISSIDKRIQDAYYENHHITILNEDPETDQSC